MDQLLALTLVAIAVVYSEPAGGGPFFGFMLPLVGMFSGYYLLRLGGALIVLVGATAFHFMNEYVGLRRVHSRVKNCSISAMRA